MTLSELEQVNLEAAGHAVKCTAGTPSQVLALCAAARVAVEALADMQLRAEHGWCQACCQQMENVDGCLSEGHHDFVRRLLAARSAAAQLLAAGLEIK